jgi:hypothetical protein
VRTKEDETTARIEFSAVGATLDRDELSRLFVPQSSTLTGGNGLGLATAQAIIADHGGRISAETLAGGGVMLRMEFSAVPAGVKPVTAAKKAARPRLTAGKAVLPVHTGEHESAVREAVTPRLFS